MRKRSEAYDMMARKENSRMVVSRVFQRLLCLFTIFSLAMLTNAKPRSFHQLVDAYFEDYFKSNPSPATGVGFHQYDHQLEDFSLATHQQNRQRLLEYLNAFQAINPRALSQNDRDDREIMIATIHSLLLEEDRIQMWRKNPDRYSSALTSSIFSLIKRSFASPEERLRSVIEREKQIPRVLQQARAVLRNPPRIYTDIAIDQLPGNLDFFAKDVPDAFKDVNNAALLAEFKSSNDAAIAALKDYQSWMKTYLLPRSNGTAGPYEANATEAYYNITLPDPSWPKEKQEEYLQGYNYPLLSNVSVHEVWPGHYTQFLWVKNNPDLSKVRKLTGAGSDSEGWAHYSEEMVLDEGLYNNDARYRLAQLVDALLRDCRYIVGIKMHTQGMTMDQAKRFFVKEGHQVPVVGEMETKRGTGDPTYLMYTLGKLEILKLREDYKRKMGSAFSLQDFHDRFIKAGSPAVKIVRRELMGRDGPLL